MLLKARSIRWVPQLELVSEEKATVTPSGFPHQHRRLFNQGVGAAQALEGAADAILAKAQQQRVAIARALATDPEIIYFDEPTSALDPELTGEVLSVMRQLAEEGMTMLVVTHEMGFARNVSSKTVFMENGVVVEQAPSREFFADPKEERTRAFLQKIAHTE